MRKRLIRTLAGLALLCFGAKAGSIHPPLPAEMAMNKGAGHGDFLIVNVRLESGEELPFQLDTGCLFSMIDKSFQPKLGKRLGTFQLSSFYGEDACAVYAAPKLYFGGVPLMTGDRIVTYDFKKATYLSPLGVKGGARHGLLV